MLIRTQEGSDWLRKTAVGAGANTVYDLAAVGVALKTVNFRIFEISSDKVNR